LAGLLAAAPAAADPGPQELLQEIRALALRVDEGVSIGPIKFDAGLAKFQIDDGILFPASPVGGQVVEMVFLGRARLLLTPPDEVEAGQLDLFTGTRELDEEIEEAVIAMARQEDVDVLFRDRRKTSPDAAQQERARELYREWKTGRVREVLGVEPQLLMDAVGDRVAADFFAAWMRSERLGDLVYTLDPSNREQITLGQFVPLDATEKELRKLGKLIERAQRHGDLIGLTLDDLGTFDTWLSSSLKGREGQGLMGHTGVEPVRYTIDASLEGDDLAMTSTARIALVGVIPGRRVVPFLLPSEMTVRQVLDGSGNVLVHERFEDQLLVFLPGPIERNDNFQIEIRYSGRPIESPARGRYRLVDPLGWYPHCGTQDRATYDVTLRWPEELTLVGSGKKTGGGRDGDVLWERRVLNLPTVGFSFELGSYRTARFDVAGHIAVEVSFEKALDLSNEIREEIEKSVAETLTLYEETFGPYPLDTLTLATVERDYSQGLLSFVTLALGGDMDPPTLIAHELAHQWWGNQVGVASYRDAWLSEAMATYSAQLYADTIDGEDRLPFGPTTGWKDALSVETPSGRIVESLGPIVLGDRLDSTKGEAYDDVVYLKGGIVLETLGEYLGTDVFNRSLATIYEGASGRVISTEMFITMLERVSGTRLDGFFDRYVYGTGIPEVYYDYGFRESGDGTWTVEGQARQQVPYRYDYGLRELGDGTWDITRRGVSEYDVEKSTVVAPVQIVTCPAEGEPGAPASKNECSAPREGNPVHVDRLVVNGASAPFSFGVEGRPVSLWLDRNDEVLARCYNATREPKRIGLYRGFDLEAEGRLDEAEAELRSALVAEVATQLDAEKLETEKVVRRRGKILDARIHLALAGILLDTDRVDQARDELRAARKALGTSTPGWLDAELDLVEARVELREGDAEAAYRRLKKLLTGRSAVASTEGYMLMAIAARRTGHAEEFDFAIENAAQRGADTSLLAP
jgi:hypothetical protein